ncbi:MAG: UDP-3-O-acyl-N-acetylglucosamine deacetylase [Proteobacteria bacterium]|nr:UDP-3-O-acyl-N-acetylglucosamine deacetylase [Pseudomonadota bacterium]MBU1715216.1 UDP-3-O-acyl-N-acetylglucosamine deacetylase [Pseudomonadota bacterium]
MKNILKKNNPFQHTLKREVSFCGIGLHSGNPVSMTIKPAPADSGIRFMRADLGQAAMIPALMNRVVDTKLATTIAEDDAAVSTTEHLLAALFALGIDNALIELDAPEVPIMDGSAGPFVHVLKKVDRKRQKTYRKMLKITKEIVFQDGGKRISVAPYDGLKITCEIDFDHELIKHQTYSIELTPKKFLNEIASARTFGFMDEVEKLRENGLALGGSLENAIVVDNQLGVMNDGGLRFADEFVRHKVLDLIGDLALLGCPLIGHITASKSGHGQHLALMQEIAAHPECWEFVTLENSENGGAFERVVTTTKAAGNMIIPFLIPPSPATLSSSRGSFFAESSV